MNIDLLNQIKRLVIIALASDDLLMESLVLKGGNAIDLTYQRKQGGLSRTSYDLDFSITDGDFDEDLESIKQRFENTLEQTFAENGFRMLDFKFQEKPKNISEQLADFWGGYKINFKVIKQADYDASGNHTVAVRKAIAVKPNLSPTFDIELSKHEYVGDKTQLIVDGYTIYAYTPAMIVFEKVRALCQQLPGYKEVVPSFTPRARARDFYDIYLLMDTCQIDPSIPENLELIKHIFEAKKVPLDFIKKLRDNKPLHESDWENVLTTISASDTPEIFDFYFNYVLERFESLTFL